MDRLATFKAYLDRWIDARSSEPINQPFMCVRVVREHVAALLCGRGNKKRAAGDRSCHPRVRGDPESAV